MWPARAESQSPVVDLSVTGCSATELSAASQKSGEATRPVDTAERRKSVVQAGDFDGAPGLVSVCA